METSLVVERNNHSVDSILVSKPIESAIKIDSISIDLINADEKTDAEKCEHFSIRGFVSEIRKKDWKKCWPFVSDGDSPMHEKQTCTLPPLHAPKFRFWRCQNCLSENGAKATASSYEAVLKSCGTQYYTSKGINSLTPIHGDAIVMQSDFQQARKEDTHAGKTFDANASCHLKNPTECPPSSFTDKRENKSETANFPVVGQNMGSEDTLRQNNVRLNLVGTEAIPSQIQKSYHADDTVAFKSKCTGCIDLCNPGCVHREVADAECGRYLNCMVKSGTKISETGKKTYGDDQHAEKIASGTVGEAVNVDSAHSADNGHVIGHPSLELDEFDQSSSESDDIMVQNKQESDRENSSRLHRKKARKVRLLTELLDGNGGGDTENIRTEDSGSNSRPLSNAIPDASAEVDKLSVSQGEVPIQRRGRRGLGQNRKRKLPQDENWRPLETSSPSKACKEVRTLKGDVVTTDAIVGSRPEDDAPPRMDLQACTKGHWVKHKSDRGPITGKKKNQKVLLSDDCFSHSSSQGNVSKESEGMTGDGSKGKPAADVLVNSVHDAFTRTEIELFPLPGQRTERGTLKGKMPQVDGCDSQIPLNHAILSEGPMTGKNAPTMRTGHLTIPFHAAQDASHESGLNLSLNCYNTTQRYDHTHDPLLGKRFSLLNWQEGASSEQVIRNSSENRCIGNFNFTSKMPQDAFFGKGLHGGMSKKRTTYKGFQDASHENGLNLSLNSYSAVHRYEGNCVPQIGDGRTLLNWNATEEDQVTRRASEAKYVGNFSFAPKSATDTLFAKALPSEQSGHRSTYKTPLPNEKQNYHSQVEIRSHSVMQSKGVCNTNTSEKIIEPSSVMRKSMDQRVGRVGEQGAADDIPMEIVELMAKNQYERCLPDAEYNKRRPEITNNKSSHTMGFSRVYGHGGLSLFQEENIPKQGPQTKTGRNGITKWDGNVGPSKQKSVDYFFQADQNQFNLGQLEKPETPSGFRAFLQHQGKLTSGGTYSVTSSSGQNNSQNCKWFGELMGKGLSHTSLQASGPCNTRQNIPQQNKEANHLWTSRMPDPMPFVYSIPQKHASQSPNIDLVSPSFGGAHKENTNRDLDPKFRNQNAANLGKQNKNFGNQTLSRTHAEYSFSGKHNAIELNQKPMGSIDLYSNETIPAMHLLSLMDAGLRSNTTIGMDAAPKFLERPTASANDSTEFSRLDSGALKATSSVKHPLYDYLGKNKLVESSNEGTPVSQITAGASGSSFQHIRNFKKASGFSSQVSKDKEKRKVSDSHEQNKGSRSQHYASPSDAFGTNCGSLPVHSMPTTLLGASDSPKFPLPNALENSTRHKLESRHATKTVLPQKRNVETEICTLNRNPTDFTIPEAGNVYMIAGEDLKFRKSFPCTNGSSSTKFDGRKRQRKLHTMKEHGRHLVS